MILSSPSALRILVLVLTVATSSTSCKTTGSGTDASLSSKKSDFQQSTIPQVVRFASWLEALDQNIDGYTPERSAEKLTGGSARAAVFNLQGLGRLYAESDPLFDKARKRFKALEDGIGAYAKWNELLDKGKKNGSASNVLKKLETKRDNAKSALANLLVKEKYIPADGSKGYIDSFRNVLLKFPWKSPEDDRQAMVNKLKSELETIKSATYDFTHLEAGNGIHEFRRKLRWFSMEARALNGLVILKPAAAGCPIEAYKDLPTSSYANGKYGVLPPSALETHPLSLTPCLYVKIAKSIDDLGQIKGSVEEADNNTEGEASDGASQADQDAVKGILDEMLQNNLFGLLQAELSAS